MFRTAILRSAVRAAARPVAVRVPFAAPRVAVPAFTIVPVRMYGAAAGLKKEEVEGRIMSLLQGFDKVSALRDTGLLVHDRQPPLCAIAKMLTIVINRSTMPPTYV